MRNVTPLGRFRILTKPHLTVLITPLWIGHLFLPVFFFLATLYVLLFSGKTSLYFTFSVLAVAMLYKIWVLFKPINIISIDSEHDRFLIRSRNYFQRLIDGEEQIDFSQILHFAIKEGPEYREPTRYIIIAVTNENKKIIFTHTRNKNLADKLRQFFQDGIGKKGSRL